MSKLLQKLSKREKVLFGATLGVALLAVVYFGGRRAIQTIDMMNTQIDQMETTLLGLRQMEARGRSIEEAYTQVAAHHSSAWTEQEIHDRLRLEIYRLAMENPPPEDRPELVRVVTASDFKQLVTIPALRQGTLREDEGGYREYQLRIVIPELTPVRNVVEFLRRLQESNHSLRIDAVEMVRAPDATQLNNIRIDVTRTVVDTGAVDAGQTLIAGASTQLRNPGFEVWPQDLGMPEAWEFEGIQMAPDPQQATEGQFALRAEALDDGATVFQQVALTAGRTYEVSADIAVTGKARFTVASADGTEELPGAQALDGDGVAYRYSAHLVPPGDPGQTVQLRIPQIVLEDQGTAVVIDNVVLRGGAD